MQTAAAKAIVYMVSGFRPQIFNLAVGTFKCRIEELVSGFRRELLQLVLPEPEGTRRPTEGPYSRNERVFELFRR